MKGRRWDDALVQDRCAEGSPLALLRAFLTSDDAILLSRKNDRAICDLTLGVLQAVHEERTIETLDQAMSGSDFYLALNADLVAEVKAIFQPVATPPPSLASEG